MIDIEAIKAESIKHSRNLSDWSNEALLKEFCWAIHADITSVNDSMRYTIAIRELAKRLMEKVNDWNETITPLFAEQVNLSNSLCGFASKRNAELRKIEAILEIKNPIPDILLPY